MNTVIICLTIFFSIGIVLEFCIRPILRDKKHLRQLKEEILEQERSLNEKKNEGWY